MINQTPELEEFISNTGIVYELDKNAELFTTLPDQPPSSAAGYQSDGDDSDEFADVTELPTRGSTKAPSPARSPTIAPAGVSTGEMSEAQIQSLMVKWNKEVVPQLKQMAKKHCSFRENPNVNIDNMDYENGWIQREASGFQVRGPKYLEDKVKINALASMMTLVGCDIAAHDHAEPISHIASHPQNYIKKVIQSDLMHLGDLAPYFFCINMQVPGSPQYATVFYFAQPVGIIGKNRPQKVLQNFINGDQQHRDMRLKIIPSVAEGSWIVRKGVGATPAILGKKLAMTYHKTPNYLEIDVDVGVSSMAGAIVKLVTGPAKSLVVDLAFLIEAQKEEELPEEILGAIRLLHVDLNHINTEKNVYR